MLTPSPFLHSAATTPALPAGPVPPHTPKRPFLRYVHHCRAVAILFIVAMHCYGLLTPGAEPLLLRRGTGMFVFLAGLLFHHLSSGFTLRHYWRSKLKNVLLPYAVVSTPIIAARMLTGSHSDDVQALFPDFATYPSLVQVGTYYLLGLHLVPFWFIPVLCGYYLLGPGLVALDRRGYQPALLPTLLGLSLLVTRAPQTYQLHLAFVHYLGVYVLGMWASRRRVRLLRWTDRHRTGFWLAVGGLLAASWWLPTHPPYVEQFLFVQKLTFCWALLYAFWKLELHVPRWVDTLANMSFGIFFLHFYLLLAVLVSRHHGYLTLPPTFASFLLLLALDLACCVGVLLLLKRALGRRSRLLVGY